MPVRGRPFEAARSRPPVRGRPFEAASRGSPFVAPWGVPAFDLFTTLGAPPGALKDLRRLLDDAFDDFTDEDWDHTVGGWHAVMSDGDLVVAHAAVIPRTIEVAGRPFRTGYLEGVATAPGRQGEGLGSLVVGGANDVVRAEFEFGALSTARHSFYEHLGWERWQGPTLVRHPSGTIRTEEEDDGVMILRFGPSASVDLTSPITCEARPGDDW